jgi:hypothetical protein
VAPQCSHGAGSFSFIGRFSFIVFLLKTTGISRICRQGMNEHAPQRTEWRVIANLLRCLSGSAQLAPSLDYHAALVAEGALDR